MQLKESPILDVSLRILFPFVVLFAFQIFCYGANSPGGGFQAGVVLGTMIVVLDVLWDRRIYPNRFYRALEAAGLVLLLACAVAGWAVSGRPFGGFYGWHGRGRMFSNLYVWLLNLGIFLEVSGSIVLLFRRFIGGALERADP